MKDLCNKPTISSSSLDAETERELTLHNVVGIRMHQHGLDDRRPIWRRSQHLVDELVSLLLVGVHDTLLDDVRGELLLSEGEDLAVDLADDEGLVGAFALLDDPLNDVLRETRQYARREKVGGRRTLPYWSWIKFCV